MTDYRGRELVVRLDYAITYGGAEIGRVFRAPADAHDWEFAHSSGITIRDLHPDLPWERRQQYSFTKRGAAERLADLHRDIEDNPVAVSRLRAERLARFAAFRSRRQGSRGR